MPHSRRSFLKSLATASTALALDPSFRSRSLLAASSPSAGLGENPIAIENRRPGTTDWLLQHPRVTPPHPLWHMFGLRCPWIEGYCSHATIRAGEELTIFVSTNPPARYTLDLYRMGYYGGSGARLVRRFGPEQGRTQPTPEPGPARVIQCDWQPSLRFKIPSDWLSGVYLGKLTELNEGTDSYIIFILRDDRRADYLFQCSDMTWQAYNRWPYNFSLYCDGKIDYFTGKGIGVGLNRPYGKYMQMADQPLSTGSGEWFLTEFPLAFWMEQHGYDVSYVSNWDIHYDPALHRTRGFLSVGHDEYWTKPMYDHVREAVANGLNAAFLCGNAVATEIELSPGPDGRPDQAFARRGKFTPRENTLMGAQSPRPVVGGADWVCRQPDHWIFENTGMKLAEGIPGLVGWEFHGDPADIPGLEIVASGITDGRRFPAEEGKDKLSPSIYTATVYPGPKGNFVFNAATCWWADGLSQPPGYVRSEWYGRRYGPDPRVQQITTNVLDRMRRS